MVQELSICGLRGFGTEEKISFALPDGLKRASGLTIIVGGNNSGKTTITEALASFNGYQTPSFSEGKRNTKAGGNVTIELKDENGVTSTIKTYPDNGSETTRTAEKTIYIVPSRRSMDFEFGRLEHGRDDYVHLNEGMPNNRRQSTQGLEARIQSALKDKDRFNHLLSDILGYPFKWNIEQRDSGRYYLKCINNGNSHSSEGLGDGVWSVFVIALALFDSSPEDTIVIDEPELSVHPSIQRRLMNVLEDYSDKRQIIICTHSVYFIDWNAFVNGAKFIRVAKDDNGDSRCYEMKEDFNSCFSGFLNDIRNPHVLGLDAKEAFFLNDNIILVEGQDDVEIYNNMFETVDKQVKGSFFGWGVGGASKMAFFLSLFNCLGYQHVVAIFDGDKQEEYEKATSKSYGYLIMKISKDDVRDKNSHNSTPKTGLAYENGDIKEESKGEVISMADQINNYFNKKIQQLN